MTAIPAAILPSLRARLQPRAAYGVLPFGDDRVDSCLADGGLALGNLHEIGATGIEAETGVVAAGLAAWLLSRLPGSKPVFWIAICCDLHPPGLLSYGLDPGRLIMVRARDDTEALLAMEAVLRSGAAVAVVGEIGKLGRTPSRRLQLACLQHGTTGLVLRRWPYGHRMQDRESSAAVTRWQVRPAPTAATFREPGPPRWQMELTHVRGGTEGAWIVECERTADAHSLRVVAELACNAVAERRVAEGRSRAG